jgi:type II secretory ATPase GspE/PulE/Tfp pilus assembly ATPase PilB-like protein
MTTTQPTAIEDKATRRRERSRPAQENLTRLLPDPVATESEAVVEAPVAEPPALAEAVLRDSMRELASDNQTSFRARIGVFEVWGLHDNDRQLITDHADSLTIRDHLADKDHQFRLDDALARAADGVSSLDELRIRGNVAIPALHVR